MRTSGVVVEPNERAPEMQWAIDAVRRLLRRLREPARLEFDPLIGEVKRALRASSAQEAVLELVDRALRHESPLLREIVRRCDVDGEPKLNVARAVNFSPRQFFRRRSDAVFAIAGELDRLIGRQHEPERSTGRAPIGIARLLIARRSVPEARIAIEYLQRVIANDPAHAEAYAWLSGAYAVLGHDSALLPVLAYGQAAAFARTALSLDPKSPEVLTAYALALFTRSGDVAQARRYVEDALAIDPALARAHYALSLFEVAEGEYDGAYRSVARAIALEPSAFHYLQHEMALQYVVSPLQVAAQRCRDLLLIDPASRAVRVYLADALNALGRSAEVRTLLANEIGDDAAFTYFGPYARALTACGEHAEARAIATRMKRIEVQYRVPRYLRAATRAAVEDTRGTLDELEQTAREEPSWLALLPHDPTFDPVRADLSFARFNHFYHAEERSSRGVGPRDERSGY